jgi:hypothetical protein
MIDSGVLTDYTSDKNDDIEKQLEKVSVHGSVDEELAKIKAEQGSKKKAKKATDTDNADTDTVVEDETETASSSSTATAEAQTQ